MSQEKPIIEINGRKYNASTGNLLADEAGAISMDSARLINDISLLDSLPIGRPQPAQTKAKPATKTAIKAKKPRIQRKLTGDIGRHPDKSATLMRPAVKKPAHKSTAKPHRSAPKIRPVNTTRLERAKNTPKSRLVKRFYSSDTIARASIVRPNLAKLEVKEQPVPGPAAPRQTGDWPVINQFEKAMQEASSHLETFTEKTTKSKHGRKLGYTVVSLSVLFLAAFGVYHFLPVAKVKMAGSKAGFSASLPGYSPAGFGLAGPIISDYGKVTLSYKSRTDDKSFNLTQAPSGWNSQALISNFLNPAHQDYQTVKGGGHTIYTYSDSNATWVDGGKWYKVEGNAPLSDDQLIKIANSL